MANEEEKQENEINPDINKPKIAPGEEYLNISNFAPAKTVVTPNDQQNPEYVPPQANGENNSGGPRSLTESMDDSTDMTDMQMVMKNMFQGGPVSKRRQFARMAPDAFLSFLQLGLNSKIMTTDPTRPINVMDELDILYSDYGIGLDGEGRIDAAKLLGAAREIKREESLIKGL